MSQVPYDKYYKETSYFGGPYPGLVAFFEGFDPSLKVLDIGCGQGRDTLMLGRLGYCVVGIDISEVGIDQLNCTAEEEDLPVQGFVADFNNYEIDKSFDLILTDSMFHFYTKDQEDEKAYVTMLLSQLELGAYWCNCIISGGGREAVIKKLINNHPYQYEMIVEQYIDYPQFDAKYYMTVVRRVHN